MSSSGGAPAGGAPMPPPPPSSAPRSGGAPPPSGAISPMSTSRFHRASPVLGLPSLPGLLRLLGPLPKLAVHLPGQRQGHDPVVVAPVLRSRGGLGVLVDKG